MPLVSVILTTYNRPELLKETIISILDQTFQDFELIVVDNFSNYEFQELIDSFKSDKIIGFSNHNNNVIAVNRNYGLRHATGKYIAFCDDDDIWLHDKLEKQTNYISNFFNDNEPIVLHSNTILFGDNFSEKISAKEDVKVFNDFICDNSITFSTVMVTRTKDVEFIEAPHFRATEDYNLWVELVLKGYKFHLLKDPLIRYRVCSNSASASHRKYNSLRMIGVVITNILKHKPKKINNLKLFFRINLELLKYVYNNIRNR
jgi:glycosyltransferase involved in cell wall biosynthesis